MAGGVGCQLIGCPHGRVCSGSSPAHLPARAPLPGGALQAGIFKGGGGEACDTALKPFDVPGYRVGSANHAPSGLESPHRKVLAFCISPTPAGPLYRRVWAKRGGGGLTMGWAGGAPQA